MAIPPVPVLCPCSAAGKGTGPPPRGLWSLVDTPGDAHCVSPLGMLTEKVNLLARENSIKKKEKLFKYLNLPDTQIYQCCV